MGDIPNSIDLPQTPKEAKTEALREIAKKAKYSRSKEFQELKASMEERIKFYQSYLPGGTPIVNIEESERGKYWAIADIVIAELQAVIDMYDGAQKLMEEQK